MPLEQRLTTTAKAMKQVFAERAEADRAGDGDAFAVGRPLLSDVGGEVIAAKTGNGRFIKERQHSCGVVHACSDHSAPALPFVV